VQKLTPFLWFDSQAEEAAEYYVGIFSNSKIHHVARYGEAGSVLIDGKTSPNSVSDGADKTADCTISVGLDTFEKLAKRELDPTSAFMQGKLRVAGDMGLAMKLGPLLQKSAG